MYRYMYNIYIIIYISIYTIIQYMNNTIQGIDRGFNSQPESLKLHFLQLVPVGSKMYMYNIYMYIFLTLEFIYTCIYIHVYIYLTIC